VRRCNLLLQALLEAQDCFAEDGQAKKRSGQADALLTLAALRVTRAEATLGSPRPLTAWCCAPRSESLRASPLARGLRRAMGQGAPALVLRTAPARKPALGFPPEPSAMKRLRRWADGGQQRCPLKRFVQHTSEYQKI